MALNRNDVCARTAANGVFVSCRFTYSATYRGQLKNFRTLVTAIDLPGNTNPTDQQLHAIADPRATALYNEWCNSVDMALNTPTKHTGQGGTVIS